MSQRRGDSDRREESAGPNINLIEEYFSKAGNSSLRNSKEEKERQNEVISYGGGLGEPPAGPADLLISFNIEGENTDNCDEGESISTTTTSDHIRDSGFSTTNTNLDYGSSDVSGTPKRSCFIDASTLYDENEFNSLATTTTQCTSHTESSPFRSSVGSSSASSSSQPRSSGDSRQDNEKRQGYLVFKNSIHQYSGHPINTTATDTNASSKEAEDFEILDFPDGTPQNSLAYIPTAAHDDDRGRVEEAAPILMATDVYSSRSGAKRHQKHDESAPIVSGGAAITDFKPSVTDSPSVKRRTEMCPIVSGGFCDTDLPVETKAPKKRSSSVTSASWIVDVSSLKSANQVSEAKNDYSSLRYTRETNSPKPSLSFYVNFEPEKDKPKELRDYENPKSLQLTKSTGFFIDLSGDKNDKKKASVPDPVVAKKQEESDTKNIFSMFIDFGENKKPRSATPRLNSSFSNKSLESSFKAGVQTGTSQKDNKETTDPKVRPCTLSDKNVTEVPKQQSIPEVATPSPITDKHSFTSDSFTSNTNSHSHEGIVGKKREDAKINETFDKSSIGSLTDGILSKDLSPISSTETDDATFQRDSDGSFVPKKSDNDNSNQSIIKSQESDMQSAMDTLQARIEIQKQQLLDTPTNDGGAGPFVKLSDMDKQPKSITAGEEHQFGKTGGKGMSTSAGMAGVKKHNWLAELNQGSELAKQTNLSPSEGNVNSIPLASSVENSKSLSRLFPHLGDGE